MANMEGIVGQFFKSLGITLVIAVLSSLVFALTLTPMLAALLLKDKKVDANGKTKGNIAERYLTPITDRYIKVLTWSLQHKAVIILSTVLLFFGTIFSIFGSLGKEFMPKTDEGLIQVALEMPSGASLDETDRTLDTIETRLQKIPEIKSIYSSLGGTGTSTGVNVGSLIIQLKDKKERKRTTDDVSNDIRYRVADLPDAKLIVKPTRSGGGGGQSTTDIQVEITGDKMSEILRLADSVQAKALTVQGLADVKYRGKKLRPEVKFIPDRYRMDEYGVNISTMGSNLRSAMSGNEAAVYREDNDEYTVRVQLDEFDRKSISQVEDLSVPTQKGLVSMKSLAKVIQAGGAASVDRKNRQRMVMVTANVAHGSVGTKAGELQKLTAKIQMQPGYKIFYGGSTEMMQDTFRDLLIALILAILLVYMVLAGALESLVQPGTYHAYPSSWIYRGGMGIVFDGQSSINDFCYVYYHAYRYRGE